MYDRVLPESRVFISVVSHGHSSMLKQLGSLEKLAQKYTVVIKNNIHDAELEEYCSTHGIHLINHSHSNGFGYNNNVVFNYCLEHHELKYDDFFLVINPDIVVCCEAIENIIKSMKDKNILFSTINLYKDEGFTVFDESVRGFPRGVDFIRSYVTGVNVTKIDKNTISKPVFVDWCAGSFMAFRASAFKMVDGFDINYFMYCEDIDLCFRLAKKGVGLVYFPDIKAVHKAKHDNRKVFSKHFWWHVKSILFFIRAKHGFLKSKSNLLKE